MSRIEAITCTANSPIFARGHDNNLNISKTTDKTMATKQDKFEQMTIRVSSWVQKGPKEEFTLFWKLPQELRQKIWQCASNQPRLIELEYSQPHYGTGMTRSHELLRVSKRTRAPPPLLSASQEARREGRRLYENFLDKFHMNEGLGNVVYFNPKADIVYFGRRSCVSSIAGFLRKEVEIHRVAIEGLLSQPYDRCCTWEASDTLGVQRGEGAIGGITGLQALHGFDPEALEGNTSWPGCKELKDVFVIMDGWFWKGEPESISLSCMIGDYSTRQEREWKDNVNREVTRIEREDVGLHGVGHNKWTGNQKPSVQLMSLYPFAHCGKKKLTFKADRKDPYINDMARFVFRAGWLMYLADVKVKVEFDQRYPTDLPSSYQLGPLEEYEITIHGSPDQIEKAEKLIEAEIVKSLVPYMKFRE